MSSSFAHTSASQPTLVQFASLTHGVRTFCIPLTEARIVVGRGCEMHDTLNFEGDWSDHVPDLLGDEDVHVSGHEALSKEQHKYIDSKVVSRFHVNFQWQKAIDVHKPRMLEVEGLASTHGTSIERSSNGAQSSLKIGEKVVLRQGDKITLGRSVEKSGEMFMPPVYRISYTYPAVLTKATLEKAENIVKVVSNTDMPKTPSVPGGGPIDDLALRKVCSRDAPLPKVQSATARTISQDRDAGSDAEEDEAEDEESDEDGESWDEEGKKSTPDLTLPSATLRAEEGATVSKPITIDLSDDESLDSPPPESRATLNRPLDLTSPLLEEEGSDDDSSYASHGTDSVDDYDCSIDTDCYSSEVDILREEACLPLSTPGTSESGEDQSQKGSPALAVMDVISPVISSTRGKASLSPASCKPPADAEEDDQDLSATLLDASVSLCGQTTPSKHSTASRDKSALVSTPLSTASPPSKKRTAEQAGMEHGPSIVTCGEIVPTESSRRVLKRLKTSAFTAGVAAGLVAGMIGTFVGLSSLALDEPYVV